MPRSGGVPEESMSASAALLADIKATLGRIDHLLRGNGSDGLVTRVKLNERALEELRDAVHELRTKLDQHRPPDEDNAVMRARWRAIAEIAVALVAVSSLAMQFLVS